MPDEMEIAVAELLQQDADSKKQSQVAVASSKPLTVAYTPEAMVDLIAANPNLSPEQYAAHFNRSPEWFASVIASDSFQQCLAPRKSEIANPAITATLEERFRALVLQGVDVMQKKLNNDEIDSMTVLKTMEVSVKALGMGNVAPAAPVAAPIGAEAVAEKLLSALDKARNHITALEAETVEVRES